LALRNGVKPDQPASWVFLLWYLCCGKASLRREKQIIIAAQNRDGDPEWRSFADCSQDALQRLDDGVKISSLRRREDDRARIQLCAIQILISASTALPAGTLVASIKDQSSPGGRTR
jgi:hypothetical protein